MNTDELKQIFANIKNDKKIIVIIAIGILGMLMIMFSETGEGENKPDHENESQLIMSEKELANEVEAFIENIKGAGETKVILTFESFEETVYALDEDEKISLSGESDYSSEHVIIDTGDSEDGLKLKVLSPKIRGVAVTCKGGDNPIVKERIITAISALFDISTNKISVAEMAA